MSIDVAADQITVADILIGSKADVAAPGAVESFQQWASEDLFPPKSEVRVNLYRSQAPALVVTEH